MYVYKDNILYKTFLYREAKINPLLPPVNGLLLKKKDGAEAMAEHGWVLTYPGGNTEFTEQSSHGLVGQQNVSGGCIRMKMKTQRDLYQYIPHGYKVTITYDNQPFRI